MLKNFDKIGKGFTLIELLVSMTIFIIVITAFFNLFVSAMEQQRINTGKIHLLNNVSYASEYIARALRMAQKDLTGVCLGAVNAKDNYFKPSGDSSIRFLRYEPDTAFLICWEFFLDNSTNQIAVSQSTDGTFDNLQAPQHITPFQNLEITNLEFEIVNDGQGDKLQPVVTFIIGGKIKGGGNPPEVHMQTTVSQRALDITY